MIFNSYPVGRRAISVVGILTLLAAGGFVLNAAASTTGDTYGAKTQPNALQANHTEIPVIKSWKQLSLPLDSFKQTRTDRNIVLRAEYVKTALCMKRFDLTFNVPSWESAEPDSSQAAQSRHARLFGIFDEERASRYGYHVPRVHVPRDQPVHSKAYYNVVDAKFGGGVYNGLEIPPGGCINEARREVAGVNLNRSLPEKLAMDAWFSSKNDRRVASAFADWHKCMEVKGFHYKGPMDANNDPRWTNSAKASDIERSVAVADVQCKKETNLVGIWATIDAAYQRELIDSHETELQKLKRGLIEQVANAKLIIDGAN